jgi:phage major head subunit gpT-like protein
MALVNKANLDAANRAFYTKISETIGSRPPGTYQEFTDVVPVTGTNADIVVSETDVAVREWVGAKQHGHVKVYRKNYPLRKWEKTLDIEVDEYNGDNLGVVVDRINKFVEDRVGIYDKIVASELLANPVGYDDVSLLNDSHPNQVSGATADNKGAALSFAEYKAGREALWGMKSEDGEPLNVRPTHLMVGPTLERLGMEVTGSDRPIAVSNAGALDASSDVVAAVTVPHYTGGGVTLVVNPRITDGSWFMMDLSRAAKPMVLFEFQAPEGVALTDATDINVFERDEFTYSVTAKATPAAGDWHLVYGYIA